MLQTHNCWVARQLTFMMPEYLSTLVCTFVRFMVKVTKISAWTDIVGINQLPQPPSHALPRMAAPESHTVEIRNATDILLFPPLKKKNILYVFELAIATTRTRSRSRTRTRMIPRMILV